jgi:hypothetical protein
MSETIEFMGLTATVRIEQDCDMGAPWEEHDGHGVIRLEGRYGSGKKPGEKLLRTNGSSRYYYDIPATIAKAKREGWGIENPEGLTKKQIIAKAIEHDIKYCEDWLLDNWHWCGYVVSIGDEHAESCWGFDDEDIALSEGVAAAKWRLRGQWRKALHEARERKYWACRDICTSGTNSPYMG